MRTLEEALDKDKQEAHPERIFLVDGDQTNATQVHCLMGRNDILLVAENNDQHQQRWDELLGNAYYGRIFRVHKPCSQAVDMALAFAAGELAASHPALKKVPWIIVSRDRGFEALSLCLSQSGVERSTQVGISPPITTQPAVTAPQDSFVGAGKLLHDLILKQAQYPLLIGQIHHLINKEVMPNAPKQLRQLRQLISKPKKGEPKLKKRIEAMGFLCNNASVVGFSEPRQASGPAQAQNSM